jgi:hypothetical protein
MGDMLSRVWGELIGRWNGPFAFRLILQPIVAATLAVRAGLRDARTRRPAYGWTIITDSTHRRNLLREGWKDVARLLAVAVLVDAIYEIIVFHRIHLVQPLIVALCVALPPYLLIRGPVNRIVRRRDRRNEASRGRLPSARAVPLLPERKDNL